VGGELVQEKAVRFAESRDLEFEIAALGTKEGTRIGHPDDVFVEFAHSSRTRLKVALLGCGTVGGGVYQRLVSLSDRFEIVGVLNLDPEKAVLNGVAREHLKRDATALIESDCDVVIELIGGEEPARELITYALELERHVITANKALLSTDGAKFEEIADQFGVTIRYSASVGGALPALESVALAKNSNSPLSIKGIINGTCNFICDQLASGVDLESAIEKAQQEGFAEADPTLDLDGTDAAQKLILLAKASFGETIQLSDVKRTGINNLDPAAVRRASHQGRNFRLIAEARRTEKGIEARVQPVEVSAHDPFATTKGAENCLVIETKNGRRTVVRGVGAGRHATTEAVMADLFDLRNLIGNQGLKSYYREAHV
jgi:homoserine dehydrogenase